MKKVLFLAMASGLAGTSMAITLWDNGPFVTHPGSGFGGADESVLQTGTLGMTILGFGMGAATNVWVADDFVVPAGEQWTLSSLKVFGYQTNANTSQFMTDMRIQVFANSPNTGSLVFGDTTTNRLMNSSWSNAYRVTETTRGTTARAVMQATGSLGNIVLNPGTYWVTYALVGSFNPTGAVFGPPVTLTGQLGKPGANGLQSTTGGGFGTYGAALMDANTPQDMPFIIEGTVVPEPGTIAVIGLGLAALAARRRRK